MLVAPNGRLQRSFLEQDLRGSRLARQGLLCLPRSDSAKHVCTSLLM